MNNDRKKLIEKIIKNVSVIKNKIFGHMLIFFNEIQATHSQWLVLGIVKRHKSINIKELAKLLDITSSAATQIVNGLVNKGLLQRKRNPEDRRFLKIALTEEANNQFDSIKKKNFDALSSFFDVLSNDELAEYCELNSKITKRILTEDQARGRKK